MIYIILYFFSMFVALGFFRRMGLSDVFWASVLWPIVIVVALPFIIGKKIAEWSGY